MQIGERHDYSESALQSFPLNWLRIRRPKRTAIILGTILLLVLWLCRPSSILITSAVGCKNKIAQIVMGKQGDRQQYLEGMSKDASSLEAEFFRFMTTQTRQCYDQVHIGPEGDGGWEVCLYKEYDIKQPCLVYSFGVGHDFRFEEGIEDLLGCEVHAFDPSMGVATHQYSNKGFFYDIGIDNEDSYAANGRWKMRRLSTIMKDLGHTGRTLDYIKMDVEFSEWPALYDWLKSGLVKQIRQLAIEVHTPEMDIHSRPNHRCTWSNVETLAFMLKILLELQNSGFGVYYFRTNYKTMFKSKLTDQTWYCCHNLHFINTRHPGNLQQAQRR